MGINYARLNRRENRRSLAIFDRKDIARLAAKKWRFCRGAVKIAAAAAENHAIMVHSDSGLQEVGANFGGIFFAPAQSKGPIHQKAKKGDFRRGVLEMYASIGCGALSAKCTAEHIVFGYFLA